MSAVISMRLFANVTANPFLRSGGLKAVIVSDMLAWTRQEQIVSRPFQGLDN